MGGLDAPGFVVRPARVLRGRGPREWPGAAGEGAGGRGVGAGRRGRWRRAMAGGGARRLAGGTGGQWCVWPGARPQGFIWPRRAMTPSAALPH